MPIEVVPLGAGKTIDQRDLFYKLGFLLFRPGCWQKLCFSHYWWQKHHV